MQLHAAVPQTRVHRAGLLQHGHVQPIDQIMPFQHRNKIRRRQQAVGRILPPRKGLGAAHTARHRPDDGLEEGLDAARFDGFLKMLQYVLLADAHGSSSPTSCAVSRAHADTWLPSRNSIKSSTAIGLAK